MLRAEQLVQEREVAIEAVQRGRELAALAERQREHVAGHQRRLAVAAELGLGERERLRVPLARLDEAAGEVLDLAAGEQRLEVGAAAWGDPAGHRAGEPGPDV